MMNVETDGNAPADSLLGQLQRGRGAGFLRALREDVSALRAGSAEWRDYYLMYDMLEILARFPEAGPYPEAEAVFEAVEYAYARIYAADALDAGDHDRFAYGLALECLWDCESRVREMGCDSVDLIVPGAWARLHELARNPHEDENVRDAAKERIADAERG